MGPVLLARFPQLEGLPWAGLGVRRTPVEQVRIGSADIWVKRDDLTSGVYGGNKVRKLEFILAHARQRGATRLITAGAAGSHHALATAVFGQRAGFDVTLVLFPQPLTNHVRAVLLADQGLGAELRFVSRMTIVPAGVAAARLAHWRERVHVVAPGGSDPHGTLGYVNAVLELDEQVRGGEAPEPRSIVVAAGTLGTAAGLAVGLALAGRTWRIQAVRITSKLVTNERALHGLIADTCRLLGRHGVVVAPAAASALVTLVHDQVGTGYGIGTGASEAATTAFAAAGLSLDATYTAKAAAATMAEVLGAATAPVLFWHTLSGVMPDVEPAPVAALPVPFQRYLAAGTVAADAL